MPCVCLVYRVPSVSKVRKVHALYYKSVCTITIARAHFYKSACTFTIVRALFIKVVYNSARTFELLKLMARYIWSAVSFKSPKSACTFRNSTCTCTIVRALLQIVRALLRKVRALLQLCVHAQLTLTISSCTHNGAFTPFLRTPHRLIQNTLRQFAANHYYRFCCVHFQSCAQKDISPFSYSSTQLLIHTVTHPHSLSIVGTLCTN